MVAGPAQSEDSVTPSAAFKVSGDHPARAEFGRFPFRRRRNQQVNFLTVAGGARDHLFLLANQTLHQRDAFFPWSRTRYCASWRMDRADRAVDLAPLVLAGGVVCWVAGFDLIYATQDYDFDGRENIRSLVVKLGVPQALRFAQFLHLAMFGALIGFGFVAKLGPTYFCAMPLIAAALFFEHKSASKLDLAGINRAFFQSNAFVSAVFLVAVCADRLA